MARQILNPNWWNMAKRTLYLVRHGQYVRRRSRWSAEPDGELPGRTWASLQDGTPIVTAQKRGQGLVVLFVGADVLILSVFGLFKRRRRRAAEPA